MPTVQQKKLSRMDTGSIAVIAECERSHGRDTPGVALARSFGVDERPEKGRARGEVYKLVSGTRVPEPIRVLTMPGLQWRFEYKLLKRREGKRASRLKRVLRTSIVAVESDERIYRASLPGVPGFRRGVEILKHDDYFETARLCTHLVEAYHCALIEDYACVTQDRFTMAWLDFNGPVTVPRMNAIKRLWDDCIDRFLVVTALNARSRVEVAAEIRRAGGMARWIAANIGEEPTRVLEYADTAPMVQLTFSKDNQPLDDIYSERCTSTEESSKPGCGASMRRG